MVTKKDAPGCEQGEHLVVNDISTQNGAGDIDAIPNQHRFRFIVWVRQWLSKLLPPSVAPVVPDTGSAVAENPLSVAPVVPDTGSAVAGVAESEGATGVPVPADGGQNETGNRFDKFTKNSFPGLKLLITCIYNDWALSADGNKPTLEQVLGSFSQQQLKVANTYVTPYLLMLPVTEGHSDKITGYEPVIVERQQEMDLYEGDNLACDLQGRISARKKARRKGESGMTDSIWGQLFLVAEKIGKPIDRQFYTMLEDDYSEGDAYVNTSSSIRGRLLLSKIRANMPGFRARFRSTVRGKVLSV